MIDQNFVMQLESLDQYTAFFSDKKGTSNSWKLTKEKWEAAGRPLEITVTVSSV